ncbi:MAG: SURF1 family protein [Pseudomonadota bacterium]
MRFGHFEFTPTLIPTIAAVATIALTASLGQWQLRRAEEKQALQRQYDAVRARPAVMLTGREGVGAKDLQFHQLIAEGEFDATKQVFLDNQVNDARAGYYVLTPMKLRNDRHYVLVNRGWLARGSDYPAPPKVTAPAGIVKVQGYGALPVKRFLELSADTVQGSVWQNVTFMRYEHAMELPLLPIILVQATDNADGLMPVKEQVEFGISRHQGYAFQWFGLAAAVIAIYLFVNTQYLKKVSQ